MQPSLEDIQQAVNKACQVVLEVSKGLHQWGQERVHSAQPKERDRRASSMYLHGEMCCNFKNLDLTYWI